MAELTKRDNDWAGDAVGHYHSEDTHHPGIGGSELELVRLVLNNNRSIKNKDQYKFVADAFTCFNLIMYCKTVKSWLFHFKLSLSLLMCR